MSALAKLGERIGHRFKDPTLLRRALTHCSAGRDNNERHEFLGDAILGFLISEALYRRFPQAREGELSRLRASLVQRATLAAIARDLELGNHLVLGSGELKSGGARRESILADALEAVISALYLDAGLETCRSRVLSWFGARIDKIDLELAPKDPKTRLQEFLQGRRQALPDYVVESVSGKDHAQTFTVRCQLPLLGAAVLGQGASRREAEQQAAEQALRELGELGEPGEKAP